MVRIERFILRSRNDLGFDNDILQLPRRKYSEGLLHHSEPPIFGYVSEDLIDLVTFGSRVSTVSDKQAIGTQCTGHSYDEGAEEPPSEHKPTSSTRPAANTALLRNEKITSASRYAIDIKDRLPAANPLGSGQEENRTFEPAAESRDFASSTDNSERGVRAHQSFNLGDQRRGTGPVPSKVWRPIASTASGPRTAFPSHAKPATMSGVATHDTLPPRG
ncbi:hypothetical protein GWK47_042658 [Chionoecetes opilio]|uniref:Uncharacterized protein n=1 Tax=Chionoecetes opilio TaxID=41210 RepID=A0A8J4YB80_CHIOP|nr:hypothetical protein GWK47_042658 [Chionoecetes opilio]